ncbi:hypothetical protein [Agrobacterium sp. DE0009]|uniref:hypothetical protein n=1 Tax=Agrobacterium sp. DE0009 TaxID=2587505 RepID=UPI0011A0F949|nr:hypothetical protein [Agrobacterium sp. DE0009]
MTDAAAHILSLYLRHAGAWTNAHNMELQELAWIEHFADILRRGATVLDIGCGSGEPSARFLSQAEVISTNRHQCQCLLGPDVGDGTAHLAAWSLCPELLAPNLQPVVRGIPDVDREDDYALGSDLEINSSLTPQLRLDNHQLSVFILRDSHSF